MGAPGVQYANLRLSLSTGYQDQKNIDSQNQGIKCHLKIDQNQWFTTVCPRMPKSAQKTTTGNQIEIK